MNNLLSTYVVHVSGFNLLQFAPLPGNENYFAACYDNGALQVMID